MFNQHPCHFINTSLVQYISRDDCYSYSSLRFDSSLAGNRISRLEVDEQIDRIHSHVGHFWKIKCSTCCCVIWSILCFLIYLSTITGQIYQFIGTTDTSTFIILLVGSIFSGIAVCSCIKPFQNWQMNSYMRKIKILLERENEERWHQRGIHWCFTGNVNIIEINFTFNPQTGQLGQSALGLGAGIDYSLMMEYMKDGQPMMGQPPYGQPVQPLQQRQPYQQPYPQQIFQPNYNTYQNPTNDAQQQQHLVYAKK